MGKGKFDQLFSGESLKYPLVKLVIEIDWKTGKENPARPLYHAGFRNIMNVCRFLGQFLSPMIEELKDEELLRKIGGRFGLSALIQKRLVALNEGTPSAIDYGRSSSSATRDRLNTVIQEILHDKISLNTNNVEPMRHDSGVSMVLDTEFTEGY